MPDGSVIGGRCGNRASIRLLSSLHSSRLSPAMPPESGIVDTVV